MMNKLRALLLLVPIMFASARAAGGLELTSSLFLGNLAFDTEAVTSLGSADDAFEPNWAYGGILSVSERVGENITFAAGFERDPTLRNLIFTRVGFDAGFAKLSVGPFFGPFNAEGSILTSGISTSLRLELPGVVFGSFRSDSTIGAGLAAPGDYVQQRSEVTVGVWVPNVLLSARLATDSFTYKEASDLTLEDERIRYEVIADTFKKNVPYTVRLNIGYENLKRSYIGATSADTEVDELGAALIGLELALQATSMLKISLGAEGALYAWGIGDMGSPGTDAVLFTARAGVVLTLPTMGAAYAPPPASSTGE